MDLSRDPTSTAASLYQIFLERLHHQLQPTIIRRSILWHAMYSKDLRFFSDIKTIGDPITDNGFVVVQEAKKITSVSDRYICQLTRKKCRVNKDRAKCNSLVGIVSKFRTFSLPPPSFLITTQHLHPAPLSITPRAYHPKLNSHLHPAPLSITPRAFHSKLNSHLFKNSHPTHPTLRLSTVALNDTSINSYSVSSDPLEIGPELALD